LPEPASADVRVDDGAGPRAIVHLPRALVALFPGTERRLEAHGNTVAELIGDLDRRVPGLANRVLDAGPTIRTHLNVFVAGERATLETSIRDGVDVHIIPAVSGG
jgi:molybdopterin synthase sulfur carrier subunit